MLEHFKQLAREKFIRGSKEHSDEDWLKVDHLSEFQDELVDSFNYLDGLEGYNDSVDVKMIRVLILEAYKLSTSLNSN